MPTAGPYGIVQFDAPGIISAYQNAQANRIQLMILQKQEERAERADRRQEGVQKAVAEYMKPKPPPAASPQPQGAPSDPLAPLPATQPPAAAPAAPQPSAADREKLFSTLLALDPQVAGQYMDAFSKMDQAQVDQFKVKNEGIMQVAAGLMQLDPSQRKAALQQAAPQLQQYGFTPEQIAGFDPSDQNLRQLIVGHMDAEKIAQFVKPDYMNVNGEVVDQNALARGDKSPVRYRSEYIDTDQGLARRPGGGAQPPILTDDDIERLEQGGPKPQASVPFP